MGIIRSDTPQHLEPNDTNGYRQCEHLLSTQANKTGAGGGRVSVIYGDIPLPYFSAGYLLH